MLVGAAALRAMIREGKVHPHADGWLIFSLDNSVAPPEESLAQWLADETVTISTSDYAQAHGGLYRLSVPRERVQSWPQLCISQKVPAAIRFGMERAFLRSGLSPREVFISRKPLPLEIVSAEFSDGVAPWAPASSWPLAWPSDGAAA